MDPNDKLFKAKLEVPGSGVERVDQGRALGWSDQSKENQSIEDWMD